MRFNQRPFSFIAVPLVAGVVCILSTSCGSLNRPDPDRALFSVDPGQPPAARSHTAAALQVARLRVDAPYNGTAFVYRNKGGQFRSDYYNAFAAPPDQLLTQQMIRWLSAAGPFEAVVDTASGVTPGYVLEGTVTVLNGDYTDPTAAKAVMAIRVFLIDTTGEHPRIVLQKEYRTSVPIQKGSVTSLVGGWGVCLREVLNQLTADLRTIRTSHAATRGSPTD